MARIQCCGYTLTVMEGIQARQASVLKERSQWLQEHDRAAIRHDREMAEMRERGREIDERIDKLVMDIAEFPRPNGGQT